MQLNVVNVNFYWESSNSTGTFKGHEGDQDNGGN